MKTRSKQQKAAVSDVIYTLALPTCLVSLPPPFTFSFRLSLDLSARIPIRIERGIYSMGRQWTAIVPSVYSRPETKMQIAEGRKVSLPGWSADGSHTTPFFSLVFFGFLVLIPFPGFQTAGSSRDTRDMRLCIIAISSKVSKVSTDHPMTGSADE